jgi:hypothetical protein
MRRGGAYCSTSGSLFFVHIVRPLLLLHLAFSLFGRQLKLKNSSGSEEEAEEGGSGREGVSCKFKNALDARRMCFWCAWEAEFDG